ncbi:MAG: DUF983 domain-containing protein [Actinobacteria bacterium]|nr:DUF983 domain-containing protein [Actinomycetota bacterium]
MDAGFEVVDVVGRPPSWATMVRRGLRRRCGRCGSREVFETRWRLRERCGGCGYRFKREPGFALGAWFLNFMVLESVHLAGAMAYIVWLSGHPGAGLVAPLLVGAVLAVTIPFLTYPHSQTLWAAIDLVMTPMELDEIVDAMDAMESVRGGP